MAFFRKIKVIVMAVMTGCVIAVIASAPLKADAAVAERIIRIETGLEKSAIKTRGTAEWRYKIENGKIYKRLMDTSTGQWLGDWILIGSI